MENIMDNSLSDFETYMRFELNRSPLTVESYLRDIRSFAYFLNPENRGTTDPAGVSTSDIRNWVAHLASSGIGARSLRRKIQSIRAFYRFLIRRKGYTFNPSQEIILPKIPKYLPDFIKEKDLLNLVDSMDSALQSHGSDTMLPLNEKEKMPKDNKETDLKEARNHLILHLLYATGLRRAELLSLTDDSVSISAASIKVVGKGSKQRIIPIARQLADEIHVWQQLRDKAYPDLPAPKAIIATKHGRMSASNLELIIHRLLEKENVGRKSPHTLRHSFATSMLNAGADLNAVKSILGHSSIAMTQIYTHLQFSDLRATYRSAHPRVKKEPKNGQDNEF